MSEHQALREKTTIEIVYLILCFVAPVLLAIVIDGMMALAFNLRSMAWQRAADALLGISVLSGVAAAVWFHRELRRDPNW